MNIANGIAETNIHGDIIKSALHIALMNIGYKTAPYEERKHIARLNENGINHFKLLIKGLSLSEPDICELEIDVPHAIWGY